MSQQSSSATDPNFVIPEGNYKQGKALFEDMCRSCHKMRGDGKGQEAPPLGGIIGRKAGTTLYNNGKALTNSGVVWTRETLFQYLKNPGLYIKGIKKSFLKGFLAIEDPQERADLIQYMSDYGKGKEAK